MTISNTGTDGTHGDPLTTLLAAASRGDASAVATVLRSDPGIINERGSLAGASGRRTALHYGVRHEAVVRLLLEHGADPNIRDDGDQAFPIHFAAERGDLAVVELLVAHHADPAGVGTTHELDAVGWAVCFEHAHHPEVARYLLAHGARYSLFSATAMGEASIIADLASSGTALDQRMDRTNHRRTALHLAVIKKQPAALAALIASGADLNLEDAVGLTALDQAAVDAETAMIRLLVDGGAAMTLPAAIVLGQSAVVEQLLRDDPDALSTTDNRRWARLVVHASGRAPAAVIEVLLDTVRRHRAGLSIINMEDDAETAIDGTSGYTALHAAAFHGNRAAATVLLKHGANPRARDGKYCASPAGWAAYAGHLQTAHLILDGDVDIFDAIDFDRRDRIHDILDDDPDALIRPFKAYATCPSTSADQWWPAPDCTPLEWATARSKPEAVRTLTEHGAAARTRQDHERADRVVRFLQFACWDHCVHGRRHHRLHDRAAQRLLARDPWIAGDSLHTAIVCGNYEEVERRLAARPGLARQRGGPRGWTPLLYLSYTRFTHDATIEHALSIARLLLDHGADPNDFYMAGDARYSVLSGVAGEGEQDAPRQPYAPALFELLLARGAEPFDVQVVYNTHFSSDMLWWLELVHKHTADTARGAAWSDSSWAMFDMGAYGSGARFLLETAVKQRNTRLAEWLLARGADPRAAPARDRRFPQRSLFELAVIERLPEMADLFAARGASRSAPQLDDRERLVQACLELDHREAKRLSLAHPDYLREPQPMFEAARRDRPDALSLLLELGAPLEAQDDIGKRPLHEAAANNALAAARLLVERGAEIDPREVIYKGTPISWASHGDRRDMVLFLSRYSADMWTLTFNGCVDRLRELVEEQPERARVVADSGTTLLFWLPDDEAAAMHTVELLLAAGADASARNKEGQTAADWARRRGMDDVAARLDAALHD